jgi:glycosyltransferase involved in cell wall biosynthesis
VRIQGGTRIKILESICWGKSIISTSSGMEGVNTYGEEPVLIADDPEIFAHKVLELVSDDVLRVKIKENARNFAKKHYSFDKFKESVLDIFFRF